MNQKTRLVIIGGGMGAHKLIQTIKESDLSQILSITLIGEEDFLPYNRIRLSEVLEGEESPLGIIQNQLSWYKESDIDLLLGEPVKTIDRENKFVVIQGDKKVSYDYLVMATGAEVFIPPIPGIRHDHIIPYRSLADVRKVHETFTKDQMLAVLGGGLLGLEAAWSLKQRGHNVALIHITDVLMERQIDRPASDQLLEHLESHDIPCYLGKMTSNIAKQDNRFLMEFTDGDTLSIDGLVLATGIKPRVDIGKQSGLDCKLGILVNGVMETSDPSIFAIGECVEYQNHTVGLVAPVYQMARTLCENLTQKLLHKGGVTAYEKKDHLTKLKVSGIDLCSAGDFLGTSADDVIYLQDKTLGIYKKVVIRDDRIIGFILYGDTELADWLFQFMESQESIKDIRRTLLFGTQSAEQDPTAAVANIAADAEICGCNGVSKSTICQTIHSGNLTDFALLKQSCKAATGCGSCEKKVKAIFDYELSQSGKTATVSKESICGCTDMSHDEVKEALLEKRPQSIFQAFADLGWKHEDGCRKCRPAINYYLLCQNPLTYQNHGASQLINERQHANIQKDGTFSVVPRMFGGLTSAKDLRLLADVAEEFNVPTIKVTGGQRIDLLGVKKEDLPKMWEKLGAGGMVSGHAYGKAVRTVKTCVGSEWCRFGTQDSTSLGVAIENMCWGSSTPHKVKLAVSGCPRNCAESTIKDIGIIAVDSGWEIYIGGNGGTKVRVSEFIAKVDTDQDALEMVAAVLQFYREDARYLERTAHWVERVGLQKVIDTIVEDKDARAHYYQEFLISQKKSQVDPWAELAKARQTKEMVQS